PPGVGQSSARDYSGSTSETAALKRRRLRRVAQTLGLRQRLELLERVILDLADSFARDVEGSADLLERERPLPGQPEAHLDHLALALGQRRQSPAQVLAAQPLSRLLKWGFSRLVLD